MIIMPSSSFESLFIEIERDQCKNVIVGVVYRPPGSENPIDSFNNEFDSVLSTISRENKISFLLGDYNIDLLKEEDHRQTKDFIDLIYSYTFFPVINRPTRITRESATIIDNIITNSMCQHSCSIFVADVSDHLPICLNTNLKLVSNSTELSNKPKYYHKRCFTDDNIHKLTYKLSAINWDEVLNEDISSDANNMYNLFLGQLNSSYNECIPLTKIKYKNSKSIPKSPWISKGLLKSINHKNKLYKSCLKHQTTHKENIYKIYRNKLNSLLRKAKKEYFAKKLDHHKHNMRNTWKTIKCILNKSKSTKFATKFKYNNKVYTNPVDIANGFNNFCINIGPHLANSIDTSADDDYHHYLLKNRIHTNTSVQFAPVTVQEMLLYQNKQPSYSKGTPSLLASLRASLLMDSQ